MVKRSLDSKQQNLKKPLLVGYPKEPDLQNSEYAGLQVGPNDAGSQSFSSYGQGLAQKIFYSGCGDTRQTEKNSVLVFFK
jgi:hypothetical protein